MNKSAIQYNYDSGKQNPEFFGLGNPGYMQMYYSVGYNDCHSNSRFADKFNLLSSTKRGLLIQYMYSHIYHQQIKRISTGAASTVHTVHTSPITNSLCRNMCT